MKASFLPRSPLSAGRRLGFHYFPDTLHFRDADLNTWIPKLQDLKAAWLVLQSETGRAIPESFLNGLIESGIEPVVHFKRPIDIALDLREIRPLLESYAKWGIRYVVVYDRPNARSAWPARGWVQQDLVRHFLDRYLPVAGLSAQLGLVSVFPPLEPGGSYWDTAFLRSALQGMADRGQDQVVNSLALAAYGWTHGHPLNWGAGGPERWPLARPYQVAENGQDQRGFRIFDWYQAAAQAVFGHTVPVFLLQAGCQNDPEKFAGGNEGDAVSEMVSITALLAGEGTAAVEPGDEAEEGQDLPVPPQVAAGCFWLLAAGEGSPQAARAWFQPGSDNREAEIFYRESPVCSAVREWQSQHACSFEQQVQAKTNRNENSGKPEEAAHYLKHYLLLPGYEWGVSDWYLEVARPYIKKFKPTIGFSMEEASLANHVTVVGNVPGFTREALELLKSAGCEVEWIDGDGMTIATQLAER